MTQQPCGTIDTRQRVLKLMLHEGPLSAAMIAARLELTPAGVRRHLDNLQEQGLIELDSSKRSRTAHTRGRPARTYGITDRGRAQFGHNYDELATGAITALERIGGRAVVLDFAQDRAKSILAGIDNTHLSIEDKARHVAEAFNDHGYTVSVMATKHSVQICQHHCPIAEVAAHFPELCSAEHDAIADVMGSHVQPLATIPSGNGVCTTNIPLAIH